MRLSLFFVSLVLSTLAYSQTFHALIFSNMKESAQRAADRTEEMKNMKEFCEIISSTLGYNSDIRCHSDQEFTSSQFLKDISSMQVGSEDIVIMFYNGHGCNWDDDDWPHMCFKDKQYWETVAYDKLKEYCGNAKLIICIGCCCNMDSSGREDYSSEYDYNFDPNKTRALFAGFNGKKRIITSSSIRGQYSYSWASGSRLGSIYGISLREAINEVLRPSSDIAPTWENTFALAKKKTMDYTSTYKGGPQTPQFKIEDTKDTLSPRAQKILNEMRGVSSANNLPVSANVLSCKIQKNIEVGGVNSLVIHVNFDIANLSTDGGRVVAFLESPKGSGVKDTNGRFCTSDGKVSVGKDFGTRLTNASFRDFELIIPVEELHIKDNSKTYYIKVGIYDYKTKKYITFGKYLTLKI